ncbi:hypothetical protein [Enterococcus caccae]|uniref:hypothetical protein n=1 Tax=Enterococcus caccae TaxID=317735 RepID=UPI00039A93E9|nr:hypothetical protein [Enterococcus caccae]OJG26884.1 hypothetical protein RU98_GL002975 [Enterococcus caccae]
MAFDYALNMEYVTITPLKRVTVPKPATTIDTPDSTSDKYLEKEEMKKLLDMLNSTHQSTSMARLKVS